MKTKILILFALFVMILSSCNIPEKVTEDMDEYARHLGDFQVGEWVYKCSLNKNTKEGTYSANVVIESISPMTFITN